MERLTAAETAELRRLREELRTLRIIQYGCHDEARSKEIAYDISAKELEIGLIEERPLRREKAAQIERKFEVWNIARAKAAGRALGAEWEKKWKVLLPEAAEEGWLSKYGKQVDLWLIELEQNRAAAK